jgi:hypothetical protein
VGTDIVLQSFIHINDVVEQFKELRMKFVFPVPLDPMRTFSPLFSGNFSRLRMDLYPRRVISSIGVWCSFIGGGVGGWWFFDEFVFPGACVGCYLAPAWRM